MERVARPEKIGLAVLLVYMIFLTFLTVHLLEENKKLSGDLTRCEQFIRSVYRR